MIILISLLLYFVLASNINVEDGILYGPYDIKALHSQYFSYEVKQDRGEDDVVVVLELDKPDSSLEVYGSCKTKNPSIINHKWKGDSHLVLNWYDLNSCRYLYLGVYDYSFSGKEYSLIVYNRNKTYTLELDASPRPGLLTIGKYDFYKYAHEEDKMNITFTTRENKPSKGSDLQTFLGRGYRPSRNHYDYVSDVKNGIGILVYPNAQKEDHFYISCFMESGQDSAEYDLKVSKGNLDSRI